MTIQPEDRDDADTIIRIIDDINAATGKGAKDRDIRTAFNQIRSMQATAALVSLWEDGKLIIKSVEKGEVLFTAPGNAKA